MDDETFQRKAYAFKIADKKKRIKCQSGGAFTALAEKLIEDGWVVYGVSYERPYAVYKRVDRLQDLGQLAGSKYVQARLDRICDIEGDLRSGKCVLFSGTPCYCSAVLSYCKVKNVDTSALVTIEFLCHGVPSPKLFRYYLESTEKKLGFQSDTFIFRDKGIDGWGGYYSCLKRGDDIKKVSKSWLNIFRSDRYLRESCYNCRYTSWNRSADITISDLWNIKKACASFGDVNGVSMILFNSTKGSKLYRCFESKGECSEVKLDAINQPPLSKPVSYQDDRVEIDWKNGSFDENAQRIMEHYDEKYISIWHGIPITVDLRFWRGYLKYKIKGSGILLGVRKRLR